MAEFQDIVGKILVITIIVLGGLMFIVNIQDQNNSSDPLNNNTVFNNSLSGLTSEIDSATSEANRSYNVFNDETPKSGFGSIILFGIVSIGKSFSGVIFGVVLALIKLPLIIFGIPSSIFNLIIVWLIIIVAVGIWRVYKLGG